MKRFQLRRRIAVDGKVDKKALKRADKTLVPLPTGTSEYSRPHEGSPQVESPSLLEGLNPRQMAFIVNYAATANATQSAINAGYGEKHAAGEASKMLSSPKIAAVLKNMQLQMIERAKADKVRLLEETLSIAMANMGDYMRPGPDGAPMLDFRNLSRAQTAALREVTTEEFKDGRSDQRQVRRIKFRLHDKVQAIELIGRELNMFREKQDVNVDVGGGLGLLLREIDERARADKAKLIEGQRAE